MASKYNIDYLKLKSRSSLEILDAFYQKVKPVIADAYAAVKQLPWANGLSKLLNPEISMREISEFFQLLWLNVVVQKRNFVEYVKVVFNHYRNLSFATIDFSVILMYFFHNPFKISKRFLMKKKEKDVYVYGETPLTSLEKIVKECGISQQDTVFELGCGRGRSCFWLHSFVGCKVVGIEFVPDFVERAERIRKKLAVKEMKFLLQNMLEADFSGGTVFYLYGTCYDAEFIKALIKKFKKMPLGTKIITVSYPLTDFTKEPIFEVMKRFPVTFTWGEGDVYLHIRK